MAKTDKQDDSTETTPKFKRPRIGETIGVKAGVDRKVPNNEHGDYFSEKETASITTNVRVLRLLDDGDLIRTK
ncbi:hypothetical protein DXT88_22110 [Herbaspirillum lusitanum]|uniref:hypothetical protein n=1 Tax=Herbaspirillum lusitanum TaxID=213312 RepID=UPI002238A87E|nr:hypothetical protein [Herbaspirillum lusitanum]MCW5300870.1 hypothetical protein [Herbaspirillum lusitanum]